jgi:tetratricopeptide (TPR) repeat protein
VLSATVHDLLAARVEGLSGMGQQVLRLAAVAGQRVGHGLLAAACGLDQAELLAALREAVERHVLVADAGGDAYAFRHALLQEVVQGDLLPGERRHLHAALARSLTARPELAGGTSAQTAAEVAVHWYESHDLAQALPAAVAAGTAAEQALAFAEAQRQFERALDLWDRVPDVAAGLPLDRAELLGRAAEAAHEAGDEQQAVALIRAAGAAVDPAAEPVRAALLAETLGHHLWISGSDEVQDAYRRALDLLPAGPSAARARVLAGQAEALAIASRVRAARACAEEALQVARLVGARREEGWALLALGCALLGLGDREARLAHLRQAREVAQVLGDLTLFGEVFVFLPQVVDADGRLADALAEVLDGMAERRRRGLDRNPSPFLATYAGSLCFRLGRWDDADRYLRQALTGAAMPSMAALHARLGRAQFDVERGEVAAAAQQLEEVEEHFARQHLPLFVDYFKGRAALALWQGQLDDARTAVQDGLAWLADAEEALWFRSLLSLGLRAKADRAEQARAHRTPG